MDWKNQDLIEFERRIFQLDYDLMVARTSFLDKPALAPDACGDFEFERRKNAFVKHILIADAQGATVPTAVALLGCIAES